MPWQRWGVKWQRDAVSKERDSVKSDLVNDAPRSYTTRMNEEDRSRVMDVLWRHLSRDGFKLVLGRYRGAKSGEEDETADDNPDDDFLDFVEQLVEGKDLTFGMEDEERKEHERLKEEKKKSALMRTVSGRRGLGLADDDDDGPGGDSDGPGGLMGAFKSKSGKPPSLKKKSSGRESLFEDGAVDQDVKSHYLYHTGKASEEAGGAQAGESKWGGTSVSAATIAHLPRFYRAAGSKLTHLILSDSFRGDNDDQMALLTTALQSMMTVTFLEMERCDIGSSGSPAGCACLMELMIKVGFAQRKLKSADPRLDSLMDIQRLDSLMDIRPDSKKKKWY